MNHSCSDMAEGLGHQMDISGRERVCGQGGHECSGWEWRGCTMQAGVGLPGHLDTLFPWELLGNLGVDSGVCGLLLS